MTKEANVRRVAGALIVLALAGCAGEGAEGGGRRSP